MTWIKIAHQETSGGQWAQDPFSLFTIDRARHMYDEGTAEMATRRAGAGFDLMIWQRKDRCARRRYFYRGSA